MTATARLGLTRDLTTDNYDVNRVNANSDKIDAAIGAVECTSSTRPSSGNFGGRLAYETDTNGLIVYMTSISNWRYANMPAIGSATIRNAINNKHDGLRIYRSDRDWIEVYDGAAWRVHGMAQCSTETDRDANVTPWDGAKAFTNDVRIEWVHYNGVWHALAGQIALGCRQTVSQNIPLTTWTAITFTTEDYDTHATHNTSSNTSLFVAPLAGRYKFTGAVGYLANDFGARYTSWAKNGSIQPGSQSNDEAISGTKSIQVVARPYTMTLALNDNVQLMTYQDIANPLATTTSANEQSTMQVEFLGS